MTSVGTRPPLRASTNAYPLSFSSCRSPLHLYHKHNLNLPRRAQLTTLAASGGEPVLGSGALGALASDDEVSSAENRQMIHAIIQVRQRGLRSGGAVRMAA